MSFSTNTTTKTTNFIILILTFILLTFSQFNRVNANLDDLRKLKRHCFQQIKPCIMFMNEAEAYGCAQCLQHTITEPLVEFSESPDFISFATSNTKDKRTVMISENIFYSKNVLGLIYTSKRIASLIVYQGDAPREVSIDVPFPPIDFPSVDFSEPNREHNFYNDYSFISGENKYHRNTGNGVKFRMFPFNIFYVNSTVASKIRHLARLFPDNDENERNETNAFSPRYKMQSIGKMYSCPSEQEFSKAEDGKVQITTDDFKSINSSTCIEARTCLPIGGHSVWSALRRLDPKLQSKNRKILAITAPMDSMAFFPDLALGASAEISSLAVLMAVAESVAEYSSRQENKDRGTFRQPVYFAWNAQSWGYAGSSRFLKDLKEFKCEKVNDASKFEPGCAKPLMSSLKFLDMKDADFSILNIGQLIAPNTTKSQDFDQFYTQGKFNDSNSGSNVRDALYRSFDSFEGSLNLSAGNETIFPIDASQSFNKFLPGRDMVSITHYQYKFLNKRYHTLFDNETLTKAPKVRTPLHLAAKAIAKSVIDIAFNISGAEVKIRNDSIDEIITCLSENWSTCELAREYMGGHYNDAKKHLVQATNYPGSFFPEPIATRLDGRNPTAAAKLSFIRRFFAYHNRDLIGAYKVDCKVDSDCEDSANELNKQTRADSHSKLRTVLCTKGICVSSDTHYHNAYGTAFKSTNDIQTNFTFEGNTEEFNGSNPRDGGWTESVWDRDLGICGFVEDTTTYGGVLLGCSIVFFMFCLALTWFIDGRIHKTTSESSETVEEETRPLSPV